jgi:hypothetical protein
VAKVIRLFGSLTDEAADALKGTFLDWTSYDLLLGPGSGDVDVLKPDGSPLLVYRPGVLPEKVCKEAYPALRVAARSTTNRGVAAGGVRSPRVKADGTRSKTTAAAGRPRAPAPDVEAARAGVRPGQRYLAGPGPEPEG